MLHIITALLPMLNTAIDKAIPDTNAAAVAKAEMAKTILENEHSLKQAAKDVLVAEIGGESWLQRNWRPLMMVWFGILVGAYWFGYTPPNLGQEHVSELFLLVQIGIGGYIFSRGAEKTARIWKNGERDV